MKRPVRFLFTAVLMFTLFISAAASPSAAAQEAGKITGTAIVKEAAHQFAAKKASKFKDVPSNYWARKEIDYLINKGYIQGYKNGRYGAKDSITRGQAARILAKTLNLMNVPAPNPGFRDIPTNHPAYKEIAVLTKFGVFSKAPFFKPDGKLTRSQMAKILTESFGLKSFFTASFKDVKSNMWYYKYVQALYGNGITQGSNGYFLPNKSINRSEFAVFVARTLEARFRLGVQADVTGAQMQSDGRLKMNLILYNNSNNTVQNIKGRYALYINGKLIAQARTAREYQNLKLAPKQQKAVSFYFSPSEVKNKSGFNSTAAIFYEHYWKYYK
ncbi:S-layer homology domain-containing protein [Bacillus xiapuensis]|uniref:S-layer homology domain-containing protein n=1 Tax=Bacillus xiapuensis TaxID=2014075 RepID=UPI000C23693C|nr:S-layer homology domain-containing protein [Bacillus xiapuensis]